MRVLLDTQAFLFASELVPSLLSAKARALIEDPETESLLSSMSVIEVALKADKLGGVRRADCEAAIKALNLTTIPFTAAYAFHLFDLPKHHTDPFDRMLIATALAEDIAIVSGDRVFKNYRGLRVIW